MQTKNIDAILSRLREDSLAYRMVSLLRDSEQSTWDEVLTAGIREELELEVQGLTDDIEA